MDYHINDLAQSWQHRDTFFQQYLSIAHYTIDGVYVMIARLQKSDEWYIIPKFSADDDTFPDIGPFGNHEDAIIQLKLMGEAV